MPPVEGVLYYSMLFIICYFNIRPMFREALYALPVSPVRSQMAGSVPLCCL